MVLAAGSGKRMRSGMAKQFMTLGGRPLLWYSLQAVERSAIIHDCVLVTGEKDIPYVRAEILERYGFRKAAAVIAGGGERYESVYNALRAIAEGCLPEPNRDGYVFIHDGARPFLSENILESAYRNVVRYRACVAAVPVKDTVKIADKAGFVVQTPDRSRLWAVQTPQVFETALITEAYSFRDRRRYGIGNHVRDTRKAGGGILQKYQDNYAGGSQDGGKPASGREFPDTFRSV